jgi:hypothetical protein
MPGTPSLWFQFAAIALSPVLALAGVGVGARLSRSGEQRRWLRDERLRAGSAYLASCNSYDIAVRQLEQALRSGHRDDQAALREQALKAIGDVITEQETVLLMSSPDVQARCAAVTDAVYAKNEAVRRLLEGPGADDSAWAEASRSLQQAMEALREAIRTEVLPRRQARRPG